MKKRALLLVFLLATIGIMAQQVCRRMLINHAGKVVAAYELSQEVDSITFETFNKYFVTAISSDNLNGSVTASSNLVEEGASVTLTAIPNAGYKFVNWTVNGEVVSIKNPYTVAIIQNAQFIANFEEGYSENGHEFVDLGLPSGIKWATCNVGASSPEEYGDYFAWGETTPKNTYNWSTYKYGIDLAYFITKYCTGSSYGIVDNKSILELEDDAAHVNWGGKWRIPTGGEYFELRDFCNWEWTTQNGVEGYKVTSNVNGYSIFIPGAGSRYEDFLFEGGGFYWSNSLYWDLSSQAEQLLFSPDYVEFICSERTFGLSVRAVCEISTPAPKPIVCTVTVSATEGGTVETSAIEVEWGTTVTLTATPNEGYSFVNWTVNGEVVSTENPYTATVRANTEFVANLVEKVENGYENGHEYVDLGLPSGTLWATCNVGATTPEEYGDYFAWGETQQKDYYDWSTYKYCNGTKDTLTKYCTSSSYGTVDNKVELDLEDDAAHVNWGGNWRMPTKAEQDELRNTSNCAWTWTTQNGVNGYKVTSKVNGNSMFLPAAGVLDCSNLRYVGSYGYYWSSSLWAGYCNYAENSGFNSDYMYFSSFYGNRCYAESVRAVCE